MAPGGCGGAKRRHRARRGPSSGRLGHSAPATHARPHQAKGTGTNSPRIAKGYLTKDSVLPPPAPCVPDPGSPSAPTQEREARGRSGLKMFTAVVWRPSPNETNSQRKQSGSEGGQDQLCSVPGRGGTARRVVRRASPQSGGNEEARQEPRSPKSGPNASMKRPWEMGDLVLSGRSGFYARSRCSVAMGRQPPMGTELLLAWFGSAHSLVVARISDSLTL